MQYLHINNIWSEVEIALEITLKAREKGLNQKKKKMGRPF